MLKKTFASFCVLLALVLAWPIAQGESPLELGLDLAGGTMVTYRPDLDDVPDHSADLGDAELLDLAKQTLAGRLAQRFDTLPDVLVRGDQRIVVSLPGEQDQRRVLETLGETYRLSFRPALAIYDAEPRQASHSDGLVARYEGRWLDLGEEVASGDMLDPRSIRVVSPDARSLETLSDGATITFSFLPPFDDRFAEITAENVGGTLAILLDDEVEWAGVVSEEIRGPGMLRGGYDQAEASEVAALLRSGNLPVTLDVESMWSVGPTLGKELQERGLLALGWSALALATILALAYGRRPALLATGLLSLASLLFFTVGLISLFGLTVDLIAIAGLVLSIGMGMDAFILVFEALEGGSGAASLRSPLGKLRRIYGFCGEGRTLVHANATTLLVVLLLFASERLQSFALFLIVGMVASLLTLVVTRWTLAALARRGWLEDADESASRTQLLTPLALIRRARPGIFRWRKVYFAAVGLVLLTSLGLLHMGYVDSFRLGSDFQPGVQIQLDISPEQVEPLVGDLRNTFPETSVRHQTVSNHGTESGDTLTSLETSLATYLVTLEGPDWSGDALSSLGPVIDRHGAELESMESIDARLSARRTLVSLSALGLSFVFLGVYLGPIRRWIDQRLLGSGGEVAGAGRAAFLGTVLAVLLDVTLVLVALAWLGIPLGMPEVAAVLTIVGYSVNDSMVLFSHLTRPASFRTGETPREHVERVVDRILGRAVLTSVSTMVPALAILAVGLEPLAGFAWAVVLGTASGTLSSIFVLATFVLRSHTDTIPETIHP